MAGRNIGKRKGTFGGWSGVIYDRGAVASLLLHQLKLGLLLADHFQKTVLVQISIISK